MKKVSMWVFPAFAVLLVLWLTLAPPQFWLNVTKRVDLTDPVASGKEVFIRYDCLSCHQLNGEGRSFGPNLDGVTRRLSPEELRLWLLNPQAAKSGTSMPDFDLSDSEVSALTAYLRFANGAPD